MNENHMSYSAKKYRTPDGAPADIAIFTIISHPKNTANKSLPDRELCVMLIKRKAWPFKEMWALPGGFSKETESIYESARRELLEETGVDNIHIEYLDVYSTPGRDPRGWMISHAFYALVNEELLYNKKASTDAADVQIFSVRDVLEHMELAFDHKQIITDALQRLQRKMLETTIAKQFLPQEFTLGQLQQVIKTVVPDFHEDNFIRKLKGTQRRKGLLMEARDSHGNPKTSDEFSQRAAQLYRFTGYEPDLSIYS